MPEGFRKFGPYVRRALALLALAGILSGCIGDEQGAVQSADMSQTATDSNNPTTDDHFDITQPYTSKPPIPPIATPTLAAAGMIITEDGRLLPIDLVNILTNVIDSATKASGNKFLVAGSLHDSFHNGHGSQDENDELFVAYRYTAGAEVLMETGNGLIFGEGPDGLHSILALLGSSEINNSLLANHNSKSPTQQLDELLIAMRSSGTAYLYSSQALTPEEKDILSKNSLYLKTENVGNEIRVVNVFNSSQQLLLSFTFNQVEGNPFEYNVYNVSLNTPQSSINWDKITKDTQPHLFDDKPKEVAFLDNRGEAASARTLANEINKAFSNGEPLIMAS